MVAVKREGGGWREDVVGLGVADGEGKRVDENVSLGSEGGSASERDESSSGAKRASIRGGNDDRPSQRREKSYPSAS